MLTFSPAELVNPLTGYSASSLLDISKSQFRGLYGRHVSEAKPLGTIAIITDILVGAALALSHKIKNPLERRLELHRNENFPSPF